MNTASLSTNQSTTENREAEFLDAIDQIMERMRYGWRPYHLEKRIKEAAELGEELYKDWIRKSKSTVYDVEYCSAYFLPYFSFRLLTTPIVDEVRFDTLSERRKVSFLDEICLEFKMNPEDVFFRACTFEVIKHIMKFFGELRTKRMQ